MDIDLPKDVAKALESTSVVSFGSGAFGSAAPMKEKAAASYSPEEA